MQPEGGLRKNNRYQYPVWRPINWNQGINSMFKQPKSHSRASVRREFEAFKIVEETKVLAIGVSITVQIITDT